MKRLLYGLLWSATTTLAAVFGFMYAYLMFSATSFVDVATAGSMFLVCAFGVLIGAWAAGGEA